MLLFIYKIKTLLASLNKFLLLPKKKKREKKKNGQIYIDVITESQVFSIFSFSQGKL
jgi:hypothetical protein